MIDADNWKIKRNDTVIGQVLRFEKGIEANKIVTKSLDGSIYIQTIGTGVNYAKVSAFCSFEERDLMNSAEAEGALISVQYKDKLYAGYIQDAPEWETVYPGAWYSTDLTFLIEAVTTA